ncbi:hypothetical protein [Pseudomonas sp. W15Feb9B]|uniref:hypothetical protein n=1 Tax=Pseudomonas sp. W15Feb9B TaxID=550743 RepID=UPI00126A6492|nr:hypothetical protein [Pseudomonas sp. W15Feb9B]
MSEDNVPALISAEILNVKLPEPSDILKLSDVARTQKAVTKKGAFTHDAKVAFERGAIKTLLATDSAGANKFVTELPNDQKIEDGKNLYIKMPHLNQELSRRIQETRDGYQLEQLKYSEQCINAVRDAPELEVRRLKLESLARREMPKVKQEVLKNSETCVSGNALQKNAEVHHIERVADNPDRALAPSNMKAVNPHIHDQIHAAQAHTQQALDELAKQNGWPQSSQPSQE